MIDEKKYVKVISSGAEKPQTSQYSNILNQDIVVTENGIYTAEAGYTGLGTVIVEVPTEASGSITYTTNGTYDITNYAEVVVAVPNQTESKTITANGTYTPSGSSIGFNSVTVNVPQPAGSVTYTTNGTYNITDYATVVINVPNGTEAKNITANGTYTPSGTNIGFSSVSVNVPDKTAFGLTAEQWGGTVDTNGRLIYTGGLPNFNGVREVTNRALYAKFYYRTDLTTVNMSTIQSISDFGCYEMFEYSSITSLDLSSLTSISQSGCDDMCEYCRSLVSVNLQSLTTVGQLGLSSAFAFTALTSMTFPSLTTLGSSAMTYCFWGTQHLTSLSFPALTSNSFGSYTNQFSNMLLSVSGCTVHFPSNLQSVIGSWSDVVNGFGGTNTIVLFDLTATS